MSKREYGSGHEVSGVAEGSEGHPVFAAVDLERRDILSPLKGVTAIFRGGATANILF